MSTAISGGSIRVVIGRLLSATIALLLSHRRPLMHPSASAACGAAMQIRCHNNPRRNRITARKYAGTQLENGAQSRDRGPPAMTQSRISFRRGEGDEQHDASEKPTARRE